MSREWKLAFGSVSRLQMYLTWRCEEYFVEKQRLSQEKDIPCTGMLLLLALYEYIMDCNGDKSRACEEGPLDSPHYMDPLCAALTTCLINENGTYSMKNGCIQAYLFDTFGDTGREIG